MGKDITAKVGDHALADGDHEIVAHGTRNRENDGHDDHHGEVSVDEAAVGRLEAVVEHATDGYRQGEGRRRCEAEENQRPGNQSPVVSQIGVEAGQRLQGAAFLVCILGFRGHSVMLLQRTRAFTPCHLLSLHPSCIGTASNWEAVAQTDCGFIY